MIHLRISFLFLAIGLVINIEEVIDGEHVPEGIATIVHLKINSRPPSFILVFISEVALIYHTHFEVINLTICIFFVFKLMLY